MKSDDYDDARITRDEFLAGITRNSVAWARRLCGKEKGWFPGMWGDSPSGDYYSESLDAFDRPIEQLMLDVLCLLLDGGRCLDRWQFFVWSHLAGMLARHSLPQLLTELPLLERLQFEADLAALGLAARPHVLPLWQPSEPSGPGGLPAEALRSALGQAMIERNRSRWVANEGWQPEDPLRTVAAQAYDQLWRDDAPALERLTLASSGLFLDAGRSEPAWQALAWQRLRDVLDGNELETLLSQVAKPHYRNEVLYDLSYLGMCPAHLDPRANRGA